MAGVITYYLPFLLAPFVSYITVVYIYPMISSRLKQYLHKSDNSQDENNEDMAKTKVAKKWKILNLEALLITNWYLYFVIVWLCTFHAEVNPYDNEGKGILSSIDYYIPYIHKIISFFIIIIFLLTILIGGAFFKWRKFNFPVATSISITVNIICVMCYWFPRILVEFINNPLQAMYNCCMLIVIIVSSYPLIWYYCLGLYVFFRMALQQVHLSIFSFKGSLNILLIVVVVHLLCCICMCLFMLGMMLRSEHGLKKLCLFIDVSAVILFKYVHQSAYKHAISNAEMIISHAFNYDYLWMENDGEKSSTISYTSTDQDTINQSPNSCVVTV